MCVCRHKSEIPSFTHSHYHRHSNARSTKHCATTSGASQAVQGCFPIGPCNSRDASMVHTSMVYEGCEGSCPGAYGAGECRSPAACCVQVATQDHMQACCCCACFMSIVRRLPSRFTGCCMQQQQKASREGSHGASIGLIVISPIPNLYTQTGHSVIQKQLH